MKLALSTLVCPQWNLEQIVRSAVENGISGIDFRGLGAEIDVTNLPEFNNELPATLELLGKHGIQVPCLSTSITLLTPAPERWQMMLEECQRNARLAEVLHTRCIRVFGGQLAKDMSHEQGLSLARRHLRQLTKICQRYGCEVALETHDYWSSSERIMEIVHEFDPEEAAVLWDVEHPYRAGETPAATFTTLRRYLRHVHFKDSRPDGGETPTIPALIGEGDLPVSEFWSVLLENRYDGWIALETEKRWRREAPEPQQSIPHFVNWAKSQS